MEPDRLAQARPRGGGVTVIHRLIPDFTQYRERPMPPVNADRLTVEAVFPHKEIPSSVFVFSSLSCPFFSRARSHPLHVREPGPRPAPLARGIRSGGGCARRSASTATSRPTGIAPGSTGRATRRRTSAGCSSWSAPGLPSAGSACRPRGPRASSSTGRISSGCVTADRGPSGALVLSAAFDHPTIESEVTK